MDKENVEMIDDEVITLYDDNDNPVDFYEIACVEYQDEYYALLQPVEPMEGLDEDEALIFKLKEQEDDSDLFVPVEDEATLEAVFEEYLKALAEEESECGCGCGECAGECDDCGDECHHDDCCCDHDDCRCEKEK